MLGFGEFVVKWRRVVLAATLLVTVLLGLQLGHLKVIVDADELLPKDHPFVQVTEQVEALFGNRYTVVIGITPRTGDVFTPQVLGKVVTLTEALAQTPGVIPGNLKSLAAPRSKDIAGTSEGLSVSRLLDAVPPDNAAARAVAARLAANPVYSNILVGKDGRTAAIYVEVKKDATGFGHAMKAIDAAIAPIRDDSVTVAVAGQPVFLAALETFSKRMAFLLPLAIVLIGLVHFEAFRTVQGLVLPLVTAILAMVWALGIMTLAGVHLDPFNNVTPILILAVAAGHAVQVLKRYYEEYRRLRRGAAGDADLHELSRQAVALSIARVGPVMMAAGSIAALSFMSLGVFHIQSIRSFGIFAGIGIFCIILIELTFTPALRAMLTPPKIEETNAEKQDTFWDRLARGAGGLVADPAGRRRIFIGWAIAIVICLAGASLVRVDNSLRGFLTASQPERQADAALNRALAGSNTFYVLIEGGSDDAIKDPAVLRGIDATQAFLAKEPNIGRSVSIVDMLKQINQAMNGGDPKAYAVPASRDLVSQYLLLYSMSGEPGDFDGLVDYPYRNAIIQAFVKTDSSAYVADLNARILPVIEANFPQDVKVRLGGSITTPTAMSEVMVSGKLMNIAQICLVVFVITALLFRSLQLGALVLVPLLATVIANFGLMGLLGIPLQIATATVSALAIGIGADYAIYLTYRLREELRQHTSEREAIVAAFGSAGKAVIFVATAVAAGYSVLMLSIGFNIHFWLGLMVGLAMVVAALSTLTLFAALMVMLRPKVIFASEAPAAAAEAVPARIAASLLMVAAFAGTLIASPPALAEDAAAMMASSVTATKMLQSTASGRFVLTNKSGQQRVRETASLSALKADGHNNRRVIRFTAPPDINGTAVLTLENSTADDDIWVYLPALKKVRRLTASNKKDAFVGTDFSYGDILGHPPELWTHKLLRREKLDGVATVVIESLPLDAQVAADTGYGRRMSWLRADDMVPVKVEFYDRQGFLLKNYTASDIRLVDKANRRFQPMRQVMSNVRTGHSTLIEYAAFDTQKPIPEDQFSPRSLER